MEAFDDGPDISVVAPCYNEENTLTAFAERVRAACLTCGALNYEIVLVDDGSRDATWNVIEQLTSSDSGVIGVQLLRNHGHQLAATAGLAVSRGRRVMLIDADLQDPPELLSEMMRIMDDGAHVVYGTRISRQGESLFKKTTAALFYRILSRMTSVPIPADTGDFRLMDRRVVDTLLVMPERQRFIRGMVSWIGGRQVSLPYERKARYAGATKYPLNKMVTFAIDAVTSFSIVPLRLGVWLGLASSFVAMLLLAYTLWQKLRGNVLPGWSSIMAAVAGFSSIQFILLGIFGEYLGRLVQEVKARPLFLINRIVRGEDIAYPPAHFFKMSAPERRRAVDGEE